MAKPASMVGNHSERNIENIKASFCHIVVFAGEAPSVTATIWRAPCRRAVTAITHSDDGLLSGEPVSYTHLDVYKRQPEGSPAFSRFGPLCVRLITPCLLYTSRCV